MPDLNPDQPRGVLREGWAASVGDYAIAGGWTRAGQTLVVGDAAGGVYAFEGKSGAIAWSRANAHEGGVLALAVHPKKPLLATSGQDGRVLIWGAADGRIYHTIEFGKDWVEKITWSQDGRSLAASCSRVVRVFGADGAELWQSEEHPSTVSAVAWSSAQELATACYGQVTFFEGSTGKPKQRLEWKGSLVSMVLSPDGGVVACGSQDNSVHFWRRSTGEDSMMSGYPGKPSALSFDSSGTLLATGGGPLVTVWSFHGGGPEGTQPGILDLHQHTITTLAFAGKGMRLASGARDGAVIVWSLNRSGDGAPVGGALLPDVIAELHWRPDGRGLAALDAQGGVTTWRVSS